MDVAPTDSGLLFGINRRGPLAKGISLQPGQHAHLWMVPGWRKPMTALLHPAPLAGDTGTRPCAGCRCDGGAGVL